MLQVWMLFSASAVKLILFLLGGARIISIFKWRRKAPWVWVGAELLLGTLMTTSILAHLGHAKPMKVLAWQAIHALDVFGLNCGR